MVLLFLHSSLTYYQQSSVFSIVHPCDEDNGGCRQICDRKGEAAKCSCKVGFTLEEDATSCEKSKFGVMKSSSFRCML